jgi:EAL and modified HD-GYP domain-containing signal transduction protein
MEAFVARQPILDRFRRTWGYELLFRSGTTNSFDGTDPDQASAKVIDSSFFLFGIESLTPRCHASINFTRHTLLAGYATVLPRDRLVVEILEDVPADPEVMDVCRSLKKAGYLLALDDIRLETLDTPFLPLADIVKVDFARSTPGERVEVARRCRRRALRLLAEKVETEADFEQGMKAGYDYFQGYFFSRPVVVATRDIPASKLAILQLVQEVHRPDPDFAKIETIIRPDVTLSLKLLSYLQTAGWGFKRPIQSVKQALLMLGDSGIRRWASLVALATLGYDRAPELVATSAVRASFCEGLMTELGLAQGADEGFLMGLFSTIDALLGQPLDAALERLALAQEVKDTLQGAHNWLHPIYALVLAYERGVWEEVSRLAASLSLSEDRIRERYQAAVAFGDEVTGLLR